MSEEGHRDGEEISSDEEEIKEGGCIFYSSNYLKQLKSSSCNVCFSTKADLIYSWKLFSVESICFDILLLLF